MHRHGYRGTKFHRERDQREALLKSLAESLILQESIETTLPKAKAVARYTEKLVTKAKKKDSLHDRRQVISSLNTLEAAHKLVDELAPKLSGRNSGYFRVVRTTLRRGDGVQLAKVSFVDDLKSEKKSQSKEASKPEKKEDKSENKAETPRSVTNETTSKIAQPRSRAQAPKRSGIRGNR